MKKWRLFQTAAERLHGPPFEPGDLHLAHPQDLGAALLSQTMIVAQGDDFSLPLRQLLHKRAQVYLLQQALLRIIVPQHKLQAEAVLPAAALDALSRAGGRQGKGDLLRIQARCLRQLR